MKVGATTPAEGVVTPSTRRWDWLKILVSGIIMFVLIDWAYAATGNVMYLPSLLLIGAFSLPLSFCAFLYSRARIPRVPWQTLLVCAIWGGVIGTITAGRLEYSTVLTLGALPTIAIGIIEEAAKLIVPFMLFLRGKYRSQVDGIAIGAASGLGFAALESMGYGLVALLLTGGNVTYTVHTLLLRGLLAPGAHIAWTSLLAGALWSLRDPLEQHRYRRLIVTFIGVVFLHALWDSVHSSFGYVVLGLISLTWLYLTVHRIERRLRPLPDQSLAKQRSINPIFIKS